MPGVIAIWGDIGSALFTQCYGSRASVAWLRNAVNSEEYLFEKLSTTHRRYEQKFNKDLAWKHLVELSLSDEESERDLAEKIYDHWTIGGWDDEDDTQGTRWDDAYYKFSDDCDFHDARDWSRKMLLIAEALRRFVELYDKGGYKQ